MFSFVSKKKTIRINYCRMSLSKLHAKKFSFYGSSDARVYSAEPCTVDNKIILSF